MKTKTLIIVVLVIAVVPAVAYATVLSCFPNMYCYEFVLNYFWSDLFISCFPNMYCYETISSYERIPDGNNSAVLDGMRHIPEVKEFLAKHVNTSRTIAIESDPIFITLHASGGYTGEYLKMHYSFDEMLNLTYGCWSDTRNADLLFTSDIISHIKDDSCLDHFLGKKYPLY